MQLVNTDGLVLIGPGSEWLWTAISGIVLAVTFVALWRELRLQANTSAIDQLNAFDQEWNSEQLGRFRLDILKALQANPSARLTDGPTFPLYIFWERIGWLVRSKRIDLELLYQVDGAVCGEWWNLLEPWVGELREVYGPVFGQNFEWLATRSSG